MYYVLISVIPVHVLYMYMPTTLVLIIIDLYNENSYTHGKSTAGSIAHDYVYALSVNFQVSSYFVFVFQT